MPTSQITSRDFFTNNKVLLLRGGINLETANLKYVLVNRSYTLNLAHQQYSDISAYELATQYGYTAGGIAVENRAISVDLISKVVKLNADNPSIIATGTLAARYAMLVAFGTFGGITNPLLLANYRQTVVTDDNGVVISSTPIDFGATNSSFTILLPNGLMSI